MKTKLTSLLIIAFALVSFFSAKANTNASLRISEKSSGIIVLRYTAAAKVSPKVSILDANKEVVYSEKLSGNNGVARVYNITALPEGEYFFEVLDNGVKTVKSITYKKELSSSNNLQVKVAPSALPGKFDLTCKTTGNGKVAVSIYSKSQGLVFQDVVTSSKGFKRTYDLTKLQADDYVFEVSSNEKVVSKEISLVKSELSLSK